MKHHLFVRMASLVLTLCMLLSAAALVCTAAPDDVTGTAKSDTQTIKVGSIDTGVTLTQMLLTSGTKYSKSADGVVSTVEISLSDKVTMKVLNGGSYNWTKATMGNSAVAYNKAHNDSTVLAAVNGDPWLVNHTDYDGDGQKATGAAVKHGSVSRGIMIIDGEVWATPQIDDENNLETGAERGTPAARGPVFAIKADGTAMVGTPTVFMSIKSESSSAVAVQGLNRLPAPNSIIIYNHRAGTESFAMADAYEIYLESDNAAFSLSKTVTGTVKAIFESNQEGTRPAITENTIVISARGSSISKIKDKYKVGEKITFTTKVTGDTDDSKQKADWTNVKEAIGSFFYLVKKGASAGQPGNTTNYPCSIIGLKKDGTVLMTSTTASVDGTRSACQMTDLPALCKELGYHTAILFDGGGSTEMVSLEGGKYVRRSSTVDGPTSVRSVISGIAAVYVGANEEPVNAEGEKTAFFDALGIKVPDVVVPGAVIEGDPTYLYNYFVVVEDINGKTPAEGEEWLGQRDPAYASSWSKEEKLASPKPVTVTGVTTDEDGALVLAGWAQVNGGQGDHYWSLDKKTWQKCEGGEFLPATADMTARAKTEGKLNNPGADKAIFDGLTVDLSDEDGKSITVYFGIAPAADKTRILHYMTLEEVAVSVKAEETTPAPAETTEPAEGDTTAEPGDNTTAAPENDTTAAPEADTTTPATELVTDPTPEDPGCASTLAAGSVLLAIATLAGATILKKKD